MDEEEFLGYEEGLPQDELLRKLMGEFPMKGMYVLDENRNPVPAKDILEWGKFLENGDLRDVKQDEINGVHISTVFLGWDEGHGWSKVPITFETMIFGGKHDGAQYRYATWKQAEIGHEAACNRVRLSQEDNQ